jgi:hypothetical protein
VVLRVISFRGAPLSFEFVLRLLHVAEICEIARRGNSEGRWCGGAQRPTIRAGVR